MNTLAERLKYAREQRNLTQQEIAKLANMSQPAYYKVESGKTTRTTYLNELANVLKVNPNWLSTGQGEMTAKPTIAELQAKINEMQGKVDGVELANPIKLVPVINEVQAGRFTEIGDDDFDEWEPAHHADGDYWLKIKGDSMTPDFNQGDLILVSRERVPTTGNYVVALLANDEKATFKKYRECFNDDGEQYHELIALNSFYPSIDSRIKPFEVIGVVLEYKRKLL